MRVERYRYQNPHLLGTVVDVSLEIVPDGHRGAEAVADEAAKTLFGEIERLQAVFSAFDPESELSRWRDGRLADPSPDFAALMAMVIPWQQRTGGLFNPLVGELSTLWQQAAAVGREPDPEFLIDVAGAIVDPRFDMIDGRPVAIGDVAWFNLNAMAKGHIVDRVVLAVVDQHGSEGVDAVLVNAGGDLRHHGPRPSRVGIENPHRPYDNAAPLIVVEIADEAVATSGSSRRGFEVGDRRVSHVLDPRTGRPAESSSAVTVVAPSAMVADVLATSACLLDPTEAVVMIDQVATETEEPYAVLAVGTDRVCRSNRVWQERFGRPG